MKTIKVTNHNNKLSCEYFGLIAPAPPEPLTDIIQRFIISDREGNFPNFEADRITMTRFYMSEIPEIFAYTANAKKPGALKLELIRDYNITENQQLAYYLFKKV